MLIERMQQPAAARDRHPAAARHLEGPAGLERAPGKLPFEFTGSHRPFCGQPMENEGLEQHEHTRGVKEARIILRARRNFRLFFIRRPARSKTADRKRKLTGSSRVRMGTSSSDEVCRDDPGA